MVIASVMFGGIFAGVFVLTPVLAGIALLEDDTERDNTTITKTKLTHPQKLVMLDNRGIVGITGAPATGLSDVEVTWGFNDKDCRVQWLPFNANPASGAAWKNFMNDGAFGDHSAHDDALAVEAVAVSGITGEMCTMRSNVGDFVTVSTVASSGSP